MATLKLNFFLQVFFAWRKSAGHSSGRVESMRKFMNYLQMQPSRIFLLFFFDRDDFIELLHAIFENSSSKMFFIELSSNVEKGRKLLTICFLPPICFVIICKINFFIRHAVHLGPGILDEGNEIITNSFLLADKDKTVFVDKVVYTFSHFFVNIEWLSRFGERLNFAKQLSWQTLMDKVHFCLKNTWWANKILKKC